MTRTERQAPERNVLQPTVDRAASPITNVRGWSGTDDWRPPPTLWAYSTGLADRPALVISAASEAGTVPECFGLGAFLVVIGRSVLDAGVIVPDDLSAKQRDEIERWAKRRRVATASGKRRWKVVTLSEFFHPRTGVFVQNAYSGAGWVIGADLGRMFGLTADHVVERTGRGQGSWEVWPPGWSVRGEKSRIARTSPHRPPLRAFSRRVGWHFEFGPCERGFGKYVDNHQWRGKFIDVLSLAYGLDAERGASYGEHRGLFGLSPADLPVAVEVSADGVAAMAAAVESLHEFAVVLDDRSAMWFTSSADRKEGRGRVDLARTVSPGRLASDLLSRARVRAPLETFKLSDTESARWCETFHGGRCEAHPGLVGYPFDAVSVDVSSCFPLDAHLIDWWSLFTAKRIKRVDVTEELQSLCAQAAADPLMLTDPAVWQRFGVCLVEVKPDGEVLPVEIEDEHRADGRLEFVPVYSPERSMWFAALDVIAAAVESGRASEILSATAYVPIRRQSGIRRHLPVLPGLVLDLDEDPVLGLVARRRKAKTEGNHVLAAELRVVVNALTYGALCRFDENLVKRGRTWERSERPGPWNCMALASSVLAGSHLLLALLKRLVEDRGGRVSYCDTDSGIVPATEDGGELKLADGSVIRQLSLDEVRWIVGAFAPLSPDPGWPVWDGAEDGISRAVIFGLKRHAAIDADGRLVDATEAGLGGTFVDPSTMPGLGPLGRRRWSEAAVSREVALALARQSDPDALRSEAPWDMGLIESLPALRRFTVRHPSQLRALPDQLRARPGTPYLECSGSWLPRSSGRVYVALDPGGNLAGWQRLDWFDKHTGERVQLSTDLGRYDVDVVEQLTHRAVRYSEVDRAEPIESVHVNPALIAHRGRVSGLIDAIEDGLDDLGSFRPLYDDVDRAAAVLSEVRRLGPTTFSKRYSVPLDTAKRISVGRAPSARVAARVVEAMRTAGADAVCQLDGCDEPLRAAARKFCSPAHAKAHRDRVYRQRRKAKAVTPPRRSKRPVAVVRASDTEVTCPSCGNYLLGFAPGELCDECKGANVA